MPDMASRINVLPWVNNHVGSWYDEYHGRFLRISLWYPNIDGEVIHLAAEWGLNYAIEEKKEC